MLSCLLLSNPVVLLCYSVTSVHYWTSCKRGSPCVAPPQASLRFIWVSLVQIGDFELHQMNTVELNVLFSS